MAIGRRPTKRVGIPNNRNLPSRANVHLENYAVSRAEHFETSLKVDAPYFYFWYKTKGSIPCSCTSTNEGFNVDIEVGGLNKTTSSKIGDDNNDLDFNGTTKYTDASDEAPSLSSFFDNLDKAANNGYNSKRQSLDDKLFDGEDEGDFSDIDDSAIKEETTDFADPLNLFSDKAIQCAICMDSGYIDGWNLHGGQRFVFDTSNYHKFYCEGIEINSYKNPTDMTAQEGSNVFWSLKLPRIWLDIIRVGVFNGEKEISPDKYIWKWQNKDDAAEVGIVNRNVLNELVDSGKSIRLNLTFVGNIPAFTHAEIVFSYRSPYKAQIPEITQGYEDEFLDWNVNLSVELPPNLQIKEGNYLTESKYGKVWKVSTLTRKSTAGGVVFGLTADLRALHSFEKKFTQFSLFRKTMVDTNYVGTLPDGTGVGDGGIVVDTDNLNWSDSEW